MRLARLVTGIVAACAAVVMSAVPGAAGRMAQGTGQAATAKAKAQAGMGADMSARCQAMMADHEKMMAEMKAADGRLDDLVAKMNAAPGTEKAAATAAVVSEMVAQRRTMRDSRMKPRCRRLATARDLHRRREGRMAESDAMGPEVPDPVPDAR